MKKIYISPIIEVEDVDTEVTILAGSDDPDFGTTVIPSAPNDNEDESEEIRSKRGGYIAWGISWDDDDEF